MIPVFVALLEATYLEVSSGTRLTLCLLATVVYVAAAVTDLVDGYLARRWNLVTDFGKLFDPLADKVLVAAALIIFVHHGFFHGWVVVVILSREFIVTGLRSLGERAGRTIAADRWGKLKTVTQTVVILACLAHMDAESVAPLSVSWSDWWDGAAQLGVWSHRLIDVMMTICLIATVASGITYLRANWDLIRE
jgi:CDP-diacylglycerol--glycerol-3-phosphate 3-phosphatidyltransferase